MKLGDDVPPVITMAVLSPAGARRDDAVVPRLLEAKGASLPVDDVIWDRGYSQLSPETTTTRCGGQDLRFRLAMSFSVCQRSGWSKGVVGSQPGPFLDDVFWKRRLPRSPR